jgi:tetratricopeptide (TPR) repeat protein
MADSSTPLSFRSSEELVPIFRRPSVALTLLSACILAVYCGTLSFEFVWDDILQIVNNPLIRNWSLSRVFFSDLWFHTNREQVYYRPIFVAWSILNFKIFGLKAWGWHLTTVLLHIIASCTVYSLARALKLDYATALLAAVFFGLHPIHIECAAWISAGSDSMVTIFFVLAFIAFLRARESQAHRAQLSILSCLLLACALLTKEMAVTFAGIVLICEWLVSKDLGSHFLRLRRSIVAALPYVTLTAAYLVLRTLVLHRTSKYDDYHATFDMILTLPVVLFSYLRLLIFPKGLTGLYDIPYVSPPGFWNFTLPVIALIATAAVVVSWTRRKNDSVVSFAALWLIVALAPVLYLRAFPPGGAVRDRYAYLPSVGFALLSAQAIRLLNVGNERRRSLLLQGAVAGTVSVALIAGVLLQQVYWADNVLVFYRGYSLYQGNVYAGMELGSALTKKGEYGRAIALLTNIAQEHPRMGASYYYLAQAYVRTGQKTEARTALETALQLYPQVMQSETGKSDIANLFAQLGDYQTALRLYLQVLEREPDLYSALYNCGYAYFTLNDDKQSEKLLLRAMHVAPDYAAPVFVLGRIYLRNGKPELAEEYFRRALTIDPSGYDFHYWLGEAMKSRGQFSKALEEYNQELKLYPKNPNALAQLNTTPPNRSQSMSQ